MAIPSNSNPPPLTVQGPLTSHQSASQRLPSYMRRRGNISGPNIGFPLAFGWGPVNITATTAGRMELKLPCSIRLIAMSWYCRSTAGASGFYIGKAASIGASAVTPALLNAAIDLNVNPSGIIYFNDTGQQISTIANYINKTPWTSGVDGQTNDPEMPITGATTSRPCLGVRWNSANTANDVCVMVYGWPTTHMNLNPNSD